jgi:hypothetical protein
MNRKEALEHFKSNPNLYRASAYVSAGILTNADYVKLQMAHRPKPKRIRWNHESDGRRGIMRRVKGQTIITWIDPAPDGWMQRQSALLSR